MNKVNAHCMQQKDMCRITESQSSLGWKGHKDHPVPPLPAMGRDATHQTKLPRASSNLILNTFRDGGSTASLNNLF